MPLRIENLSKRYANNWALRDVEFEVGDGEVFGIFGANASGKTALLRTIAKAERPGSGSVLLDQRPLAEREIYLADGSEAQGLTGLFGRKRQNASSGESRIQSLVPAFNSERTVLGLDDPFAGIDGNQREHLTHRIREIASEGRIVLFASPDFEQIAAICDRVAILVGGYVVQVGTPQEIYDRPESAAVAAIAGRTNLFTARRLTSTNADLPEFFTIDGEHRVFARHTEKRDLGAINQNVTLAIRPEQISITFGASFPEDNLLKAIVTAIRFRGETTLVEFDAGGLRLEARVFRVVGLNVGDECMIGMPPHLIQVLKY